MSVVHAPVSPWPQPQPIPADLLPVREFDYALLPASIAPWVEDIATRMQCPPDYVAVAAMGTLSGAVGRRVAIEPKRHDDWRVYATVWALAVGRPGLMKSPALAEALKPLRRLEAEARVEHAEVMEEHQLSAQAAELVADAMKSKAKAAAKKGQNAEVLELLRQAQSDIPEPPVQRRFMTSNATTEALAELLIATPEGILVERDEVAGLLKTMAKEGNEELRAFYLQGYDGASGFTFDRIGRGLDRHVPAVWLSLVGAIQPGVLRYFVREAMRGGGGDDGLLQRFGLLVWPDPPKYWRNIDRYPETSVSTRAFDTVKALSQLGAGCVDDNGLPIVRVMKFDDGGQLVFNDWRAELERELRAEALPPALESHLAKYRKLMPTLALLCAVADGEREVISERHALQGTAWCTYLRSHAERMYQAGNTTATEGAKLLLRRIREGRLPDAFTSRDVQRKGWSHLTDREEVGAALELLADLNHLEVHEIVPRTGRPSIQYEVNPRTREVAA